MSPHHEQRPSLSVVLSQSVLCEEILKPSGVSEDSVFYDPLRVPKSARSDSDNSTCTGASTEDSSFRFAEPAQTLIFLDWDDTLCPTTDLVRRRVFQEGAGGELRVVAPFTREISTELERWGDAVYQFLCLAKNTGACVAVITNSTRPWVDTCIDCLAPRLRQLFGSLGSTLRVVYADEVPAVAAVRERQHSENRSSCCFEGWRALVRSFVGAAEEDEKLLLQSRCTRAKHAAMKREAEKFYSRYPGQTWKNILCMGDMNFEHDAVRQLAEGRARISPQRERLRVKTVLTPRGTCGLSIVELTLHLKFSCCLLRAYAGFDDDFNIDLSRRDALADIASTLQMPQLQSASVPPATFGWAEEAIDDEAAAEALDQVVIAVQEWMMQPGTFQHS